MSAPPSVIPLELVGLSPAAVAYTRGQAGDERTRSTGPGEALVSRELAVQLAADFRSSSRFPPTRRHNADQCDSSRHRDRDGHARHRRRRLVGPLDRAPLSPRLRSNTRIVILDKQHRVGGWCRAVRIPSQDADDHAHHHKRRKDSALVFETGPRSIRPVGLSGWLTLQMASPVPLMSFDFIR